MRSTRPLALADRDHARFWSKVAPVDSNGCRLWLGSVNRKGYGQMMLGSRRDGSMSPRLAHRIAYTILRGQIPSGTLLDHTCHTPACVSVDHLRPADFSTNGTNRSGAQSNSKSGIRGVTWSVRRQQWVAQAQLNYRHHTLGYFDDVHEAEATVVAWRREHMPYSVLDQAVSA